MSRRINQLYQTWEVVEQLVRRTTIRRQDIPLKGKDLRTAQDAILLWEMALYDLTSSYGSPWDWNPEEHIKVTCSMDLFGLVTLLKTADQHLITSCIENDPASWDSFKHCLEEWEPMVDALLHPLWGLMATFHLDGDSQAFRQLHTVFVFLSRLSLKAVDDLRDKAMQDYLDNENRLSSVKPTTEEAAIIASWFPRHGDVRYSPLYQRVPYRHGPKGVADCGRSLAQKYKHIGADDLTRFLDLRTTECAGVPRPSVPFKREGKVVFVPKSVTSLRTICEEPVTLMWYQQGFSRKISALLKGHKYLKRRISLEHQELNRELAFLGSIDGSFATIDLSSASDSVSWLLVKTWFQQTPLREIFWCCRSRSAVLPDGSIVSLNKFAPMGSALCFPVECLVFAAIVEAAIREVGGRPHASLYRVYGDDIIVESEYAEAVMSRLKLNGFLPNKEKSYTYTDSDFIYRESCGGEFLNGDDVTPLRLSRKFRGLTYTVNDSSTIESLIDLANDCYDHLPTVRTWIIRKLNKLPHNLKVPFSTDGRYGLYSPEATNFHLVDEGIEIGSFYSLDYQVCGNVVGGTKTSYYRANPDDEDIRLFEYLRLTEDRRSLELPEDSCRVRLTLPRQTKWSSRYHFGLNH